MSLRKFSTDQVQLALGALAVVLVLSLVVLSLVNRGLQRNLQFQQAQINTGRATQQVSANVIRDLAQLSVRDAEISALLKKHGFEVKATNNNSTPSTQAPVR